MQRAQFDTNIAALKKERENLELEITTLKQLGEQQEATHKVTLKKVETEATILATKAAKEETKQIIAESKKVKEELNQQIMILEKQKKAANDARNDQSRRLTQNDNVSQYLKGQLTIIDEQIDTQRNECDKMINKRKNFRKIAIKELKETHNTRQREYEEWLKDQEIANQSTGFFRTPKVVPATVEAFIEIKASGKGVEDFYPTNSLSYESFQANPAHEVMVRQKELGIALFNGEINLYPLDYDIYSENDIETLGVKIDTCKKSLEELLKTKEYEITPIVEAQKALIRSRTSMYQKEQYFQQQIEETQKHSDMAQRYLSQQGKIAMVNLFVIDEDKKIVVVKNDPLEITKMKEDGYIVYGNGVTDTSIIKHLIDNEELSGSLLNILDNGAGIGFGTLGIGYESAGSIQEIE